MKSNLLLSSVLMATLLSACGKDDASSASGRTMVIEVGSSADLQLADDKTSSKPADDDENSVNEQEIQACRDVFGEGVTGWKIAGSENAISLEATSAFATKITGNQNVLNLVIKAKEGEEGLVEFPGVCLVLGGNQATVNATLSQVALTKFKVIAKGNKSQVNVKLEKGSTLPTGSQEELSKSVTVTVAE